MSGSKTTKIVATLRNLVINWPPLILFVACLVMFSGVTLVLGAYVYNTEGIPDRDTLSWNQFLKSMEHHSLCRHHVPPSAANVTEDAASASILVTASGWFDQLTEPTSNGSLELTLEDPSSAGLNVSLRPVAAGGSQLLCVRLRGPAARLPHPGHSPPPACDSAAPSAAPAGVGAVELIMDGAAHCPDGGARFTLEYTPATAWDITLSMANGVFDC
ncbi:hypothetical protein FJT64_007056 [Amphibalanus amphitrite]|uniref:TMEM248/TMEM219 domain-containing protein n=1 Tax=Amphibalanus amphitrite TaxID=1232801 RepID=A0A6A4W135_AMPAM|nr:hypothetical protein FJT64_007056 [Amphibalanus amphitrite]